jgi:hypothetical protein
MHLGVTPISATRACMQFALPEHEGADILGMALLWQHCIRTCVLGPLQTVAAVSAGTAQPCLTLSQLQKHWEDKVEAKILSQLGTTAGTDSSIKKGCGPLLVALVSALKSKLGGAAVRVPGDLLDAFSSASMLDWISRYSESVHTSNTATPYQTKFGKTSDFLARVVQLTVQEWTSVLREPAGQNNVTLAVSTSTSMDITLADFRKMTAVSGSKLVAFFYERLHPSAKLTGSVGNGHSSRVAREQELTNKQKVCHCILFFFFFVDLSCIIHPSSVTFFARCTKKAHFCFSFFRCVLFVPSCLFGVFFMVVICIVPIGRHGAQSSTHG